MVSVCCAAWYKMVVTVNHAISHGLRLSLFILPFAIMVVPDTLSCPGGSIEDTIKMVLNWHGSENLEPVSGSGSENLFSWFGNSLGYWLAKIQPS